MQRRMTPSRCRYERLRLITYQTAGPTYDRGPSRVRPSSGREMGEIALLYSQAAMLQGPEVKSAHCCTSGLNYAEADLEER